MDTYLKAYDLLERNIVYDFRLGSGGIGDLTKFLIYVSIKTLKYTIWSTIFRQRNI